MFILDRKRLSVIILLVLFGIFTFLYRTEEEKMEEEQYVTALPVSNKVVVLDAGHGIPDEGVSLLLFNKK